MWKECKTVMLYADVKATTPLGFQTHGSAGKDLVMRSQGNSYNPFYPQHLYILSDDEIKQDDWYYYKHFGEDIISQAKETTDLINLNEPDKYFKKIIATTNSSLIALFGTDEEGYRKQKNGLPQIPEEFIQLFIQKYNSGEVIDKVLVEYEEAEEYDIVYGHANKFPRLLVNSVNKINIKLPEEKRYSKEEVIQIAWNAWHFSSFQKKENTTEEHFKQWTEENLK